MTQPKQSAISQLDWDQLRRDVGIATSGGGSAVKGYDNLPNDVTVIAVANFFLPDTDPRKLTHERLDDLRLALANLAAHQKSDESEATAFIEALRTYLPPRG